MFPVERRLNADEIKLCKQYRDKIERFVKIKLTSILKLCRSPQDRHVQESNSVTFFF